jgi:hypothetical protein
MGEPKEKWAERIRLHLPFRVTEDVMARRTSAHGQDINLIGALYGGHVGSELGIAPLPD